MSLGHGYMRPPLEQGPLSHQLKAISSDTALGPVVTARGRAGSLGHPNASESRSDGPRRTGTQARAREQTRARARARAQAQAQTKAQA